MKKYLFVTALAALLVFAFAAVAGAKYAGYALDGSRPTPAGPASTTPGYLSWGGAIKLMASNGVAANMQSTAHGGYVTTTTKCAVCHSVHRATGGGATAGTINNLFLTAGGASCVQCHTAWGSTQAALLVEWANPAGGPHGSESCANCHEGGIHGTGTSKYWGMNAYMLGGANDAQIDSEIGLQLARSSAGGLAVVAAPGTAAADTALNNTWFFNGSDVNTTIGDVPASFKPSGKAINAHTYAAARSLLTSYTCSQAGCHVNSVLGNLTWGQTYARRQLASSGSDTTASLMMTTGHSSAPGANSNHPSYGSPGDALYVDHSGCSPCHPGNPAGGYRVGVFTQNTNGSARSYGCDQCHDAVGVATNSTAFPHGNRNISVYEWTNGVPGASVYAAPLPTPANSGNVWMYQSNMASTKGSAATLVDPSVKLIQGASQGKHPVLGPTEIGMIVDGTCLKCHVAADAQSALASGLPASSFTVASHLLIGAGHHGSPAVAAPGTNGGNPTQWVGASLSDINPYDGSFSGASAQFDSSVVGGANGNHLLYLWR